MCHTKLTPTEARVHHWGPGLLAYIANEGAVAERAKLLVGRIIIWEAEMWVLEKG